MTQVKILSNHMRFVKQMQKYTLGYWYYQFVHKYSRLRKSNLLNNLISNTDFTVTTYSKQTAYIVIAVSTDNSSKTDVQSSLDPKSSQHEIFKKIVDKKCAWLQEDYLLIQSILVVWLPGWNGKKEKDTKCITKRVH